MSNSSTAWTVAHQAPLSSTVSQSLLKLMFIESVFLTNHLILCHPLLFLPSVFLSIMVLSNESTLYIRWPKYWNLNFSFSPSNKYSGLISFRIDRFDLLAVQGIVKSLLWRHNSKVSVLQHSAFFMVQLSFNPLHALNPSSQQGLSHMAKICASLGFKAQIRWMALCPCNSAVLLLSLKPCFIHLQLSSWFISSQITIISIDSSNSLPKPCLFPRHFYFYKSISYYRVCWKAYNSD